LEITEVRVKLVDGGQDKLRAFCSITIDDAFVVRDLKIIEGTKGLFVAMPSRKLTTRCSRCGFKNQVRSNYCNECGTTLPPDSPPRLDGKGKLHADIAHPINSECRERLQARVVESYLEEVDASKQPGYRPRDLDDRDLTGSDEESAGDVPGEGPSGEGIIEPVRRRIPERFAETASERTPLIADRSFVDRGILDRTPSERTPSERIASDRTAVERGPSARGPSESDAPDRPAVAGSGRARPGPERPRDERRAGEPPRRPTGRERGPLAEMPPPDDNFSAGIF